MDLKDFLDEFTLKMKTDEEVLRKILEKLKPVDDSVIVELQDILSKSQNRRPNGDADGTISERTWNLSKRLLDALITYDNIVSDLKSAL